MKEPNTNQPSIRKPVQPRGYLKLPLSGLASLAIIAGLFWCGWAAQAQPVLKLRFGFDDAGPGTTTPSDTSSGGVAATLQMLNNAGAPIDYHGAPNSGIAGAITGSRALDFSSTIIQGGAGPIAAITNSTLGLGDVSAFTVSMWYKQNAMLANNIGPRMFILAANTASDTAQANSLGMKFQSSSQLYFHINTGNPTASATFSANLPTNVWVFVAVTYDGTNVRIYEGTDTSSAMLISTTSAPGQIVSLGATGALYIGNRRARDRDFGGWIDDFQFYTGAGDAAFVENLRSTAAGNPPVIGNVYPDGSTLQQGANTLTFTASSPIGLAITNIQAILNGTDISSSLVVTGPATSNSVTYAGLRPSQIYAASLKALDANGSVGTFNMSFDTFDPASFTWEAEEFDHDGGQFIDNPDYTTYATNTSYFGLDSVPGIDTFKVATANSSATDYRVGAGDGTKTQTGLAIGEQLRLKFLNNVADSNAVDHAVGYWSSSDWENYTRTFPAGKYNVYGRFSAGAGSATIHLDRVTSGQGTSTQTTTNLGIFSFSGTSYNSYQWVALRDNVGNLATVSLAGQNTVRVTTGGGANANFYILVPANTNLPIISAVYPDGRVLFQSTNKLVFTVSSASTTISTNSVQLTLNGVNVSSNMVFSGSASSWNVSYTGLLPSQTYATVISVTDANGGTANSTFNIDTYNAVFQIEAEDYDFDPTSSPIPSGTGNRFIDNPVPTTGPAANSYFNQVGLQDIDEHTDGTRGGVTTSNYRPNDLTATTPVTDATREQFLNAGAPDYNIGFLGNFFWQNYTRTFPTGTFNVYARLARGDAGTVTVSLDEITGGWGTTAQFTKRVGTFSLPGGGGWSAYKYSPLIDRFGNYANVTLGGTNTFRTTVSLPVNANFYMLTPARTDLPRIDNVYPDGSLLMQKTNIFSFVASSPTYGISTTNIVVTLNGVNISTNLVISGSSTSWNVSYPNLQPSTDYTAVITVTDLNQKTATTTVTFDTFNPNNFTWEAEDFDFESAYSPIPSGTGNRYIDNPAPTSSSAANSYFGQLSALGIDVDALFGTYRPNVTFTYRPSDYVVTENGTDVPRQSYLNAQLASLDPTIIDHDVAYWTNAAFINWTRTCPAGDFYVYGRLAGGNGAFNLALARVTGGWGTASQTAQYLGTFKGTGTSFTAWQWVPLVNTNTGQRVVLPLGGTNTFQMTADGNENANFFMLVPMTQPVTLTAAVSGGNIVLSFPTQAALTYTIYYKNNLTDPNWTALGLGIAGDGTVKSVPDGLNGNRRFYRLSVE